MTPDEKNNPPSFQIRVYDFQYNNLYDKATLELSPLIVDLDIDSDNTYPGIDGQPSRSEEEEFFESYLYAPGKIIKPNWGHYGSSSVLDCWNGYSNGGANNSAVGCSAGFYPIILQIPDYVPLSDMSIRITYPMASVAPPANLNAPPPGGDGTIRIWTKNGLLSRNGLIITAGGDFVMSTGDSVSYTPAQLGFTDSNRTIILYVEGVRENAQTTRSSTAPNELGVPNTRINFSVTINNFGTIEDEVKYVVANTGSFYYELMTHPELMATYASSQVYSHADSVAFGLRVQNTQELADLGFSSVPNNDKPSDISLLSSHGVYNGFTAALYREYITGKYILAFAGTEMLDLEDWSANYNQALGHDGVAQYEYAKQLGTSINDNNTHFNNSNSYLTYLVTL